MGAVITHLKWVLCGCRSSAPVVLTPPESLWAESFPSVPAFEWEDEFARTSVHALNARGGPVQLNGWVPISP